MLEKLKLQRYLKEETGVSLIMAIMTLFVLSIIGVTLATVTFANVKLTTTDREYQSAYYIAEAGVNQTYAEIKELILESYAIETNESDFYSAIASVLLADNSESPPHIFASSFGKEPEVQITITKIDDGNPGTYQISSKGKIGKRERTVTKEFVVNWVPKGGSTPMPYLPEGVAAIVKSNANIHNVASINGDLYLESDTENSISIKETDVGINGDLYLTLPNTEPERQIAINRILNTANTGSSSEIKNLEFEFDWEKLYQFFNNFPIAPDLPQHEDVTIGGQYNKHDVIKNGNLNINSYLVRDENFILNLDQNYHFNRATFDGDYTLKINVGHEDRVLVFDELLLTNGNIIIEGTGNLTIFVKEKLTFSNGSDVNVSGNTNQLTLQYDGPSQVDFSNVNMKGHILVRDANVTLDAGVVKAGMFISGGNSLQIFGTGAVEAIIVSPDANVGITGIEELKGVVIADKLHFHDAGMITYKQVDTSKFPFDFITVPNVPAPPGGGDTGGLITPKPNTE